jgi:hypothetical protein
MELVIKIPEEMWERIKDGYVPLGISKYLKKGTPLPKGHGRLIDENKITKCEQIGLIIKDGNITRCLKTDAPTIMEADKAESEE